MGRSALVAVLVGALLAPGCGTVANLADRSDGRPFGGVMRDVEHLGRIADGQEPQGHTFAGLLGLGLVCADTALSLVGDALTYPLVRLLAR